jgi:hypothetical protein
MTNDIIESLTRAFQKLPLYCALSIMNTVARRSVYPFAACTRDEAPTFALGKF